GSPAAGAASNATPAAVRGRDRPRARASPRRAARPAPRARRPTARRCGAAIAHRAEPRHRAPSPALRLHHSGALSAVADGGKVTGIGRLDGAPGADLVKVEQLTDSSG